MAVALASYATPRFAGVQRELNESAAEWGITRSFSYTEQDLYESDYYAENRGILDEICGAGYWAWKPYFILQALASIEEGDVLFYCDAGSRFISSPDALISLCQRAASGVLLFDARPLRNRQFVKRDCFVRLGCDEPRHWDAWHVIATIVVLRNSELARALMSEWLQSCQDRMITDDPNVCGLPNLDGYLQHRWDQAILSVLASKHGLETYRNPTVWGNFLKMPEFRVAGEIVTSPYALVPDINGYAEIPQANSPYGTIFEINRMPNYEGKQPMPGMPATPRRSRPFLPALRRFFRDRWKSARLAS